MIIIHEALLDIPVIDAVYADEAIVSTSITNGWCCGRMLRFDQCRGIRREN